MGTDEGRKLRRPDVKSAICSIGLVCNCRHLGFGFGALAV